MGRKLAWHFFLFTALLSTNCSAFSSLFLCLESSALYSATTLHPSSNWSPIHISFCHLAINSIAWSFTGVVECLCLHQRLVEASIECMEMRRCKWAIISLTHGFWGITGYNLVGRYYHPQAFGPGRYTIDHRGYFPYKLWNVKKQAPDQCLKSQHSCVHVHVNVSIC